MQAHSLNANQNIPGARQRVHSASQSGSSPSFRNILSEQSRHVEAENNHILSNPGKIRHNAKLMALGKISSENPTVSDLLVKHPRYGKKCWSIIHSEKNNHKRFNQIQSGTPVFMDPKTFEISWKNDSENAPRVITDHHRYSFAKNLLTAIEPSSRIHVPVEVKNDLKPLGMISRDHPTVSNLLIKHPKYAENCWQIIHSEINQNKPFDKLNIGTKILINPKTLELTWEKNLPIKELSATSIRRYPLVSENIKKSIENSTLSDQLESAVRSLVGKPYVELDCYELVIQGLEQIGIRYSGKNGLKEMLVKKALGDGLPLNSYLTGDGLIHTAGRHLFSKTVSNPAKSIVSAHSLLKEMEPYLNNGLILSFSTPTRGHMGIISNQNQVWTFINSGTMDHQMRSGLKYPKRSKGVGEERLLPEIRNWLRLAHNRKEPLQITLGQISEKRLLAQSLSPTNV